MCYDLASWAVKGIDFHLPPIKSADICHTALPSPWCFLLKYSGEPRASMLSYPPVKIRSAQFICSTFVCVCMCVETLQSERYCLTGVLKSYYVIWVHQTKRFHGNRQLFRMQPTDFEFYYRTIWIHYVNYDLVPFALGADLCVVPHVSFYKRSEQLTCYSAVFAVLPLSTGVSSLHVTHTKSSPSAPPPPPLPHPFLILMVHPKHTPF